MITFMSSLICITNRHLCKENFLDRIRKVSKAQPTAILLREKDLSEGEYMTLAKQVIQICQKDKTLCILHTFAQVAKDLGVSAFHCPLHVLRELSPELKSNFSTLGASCHSLEEALEAQSLGCSYIIVGHIFNTDCKQGLSGRGIDFLRTICQNISIPIYAIGGINNQNYSLIKQSGATGACTMSGLMQCQDVYNYLSHYPN